MRPIGTSTNISDAAEMLVSDTTFVESYFEKISKVSNEFSSKYSEGYGDSYDASLKSHPYAKNIGISEICRIGFSEGHRIILDVFGGSGQFKIATEKYLESNSDLNIITADIEVDQIQKAMQANFPAILLNASNMEILRDDVFDCVVFAYGFHHLPYSERLKAIKEAIRVTKDSGSVIIHEGMKNGITQKLSYSIIDCHGSVPHLYQHPSYADMLSYFSSLDVTERVQQYNIFDPHIIVGEDEEEAKESFTRYYKGHYSLPTSWNFSDLEEAILSTYNSHEFYGWETDKISKEQSWILNEPFKDKFFLGVLSETAKKALFRAKHDKFKMKEYFGAVVPRYAKVFKIQVIK